MRPPKPLEFPNLAANDQTIAAGIDLGTTRSVIARLDRTGRPVTVPNLEGDNSTPSVVFFDQTEIIVGKEAIKAAEHEPERVVEFAKRNLGKKDHKIKVAGRQLPPEVIQALILAKLKQDAEKQLGSFHECVITVPAYFNEPRRKAIQDAGRLAGLNVLDIINEPTAAALAYGVHRGFIRSDGSVAAPELVLVYDLGGGTFDVTLMQITGRDFSAVSTAGDVYLGGIDWDQRIAAHVAEQFQIQHGIDPRNDAVHRQRLLTAAEDAKRSLSQREQVQIRFAADGKRVQVAFDRDQFESMCGDLVDRTLMTTRKALREANKTWADVSRLLLVGGSCRLPMVEKMLQKESGLTPDRSISPDESVAHGAAIYAGILLNTEADAQQKLTVTNVNSHDLGLLGVDKSTGEQRRSVMIPRNSPLPARKGKRFSTSRPNQRSVLVKVVEGGDDKGRHATVIGDCHVKGLPENLPAETPVDVYFNYGRDGRLHVQATLPSIGKTAKLTIERDSGLTDSDISHWTEQINAGIPEADTSTEADPSTKSNENLKLVSTAAQAPQPPVNSGEPEPTTKSAGGWKSRRQQIKAGGSE